MSDWALNKYSKGAVAFHWIIAILIIANIGLAEFTSDMSREARGPYMDLHKSFGICILFLSLGRLGWRWTHAKPALPESLASWERMLSKFVHFVFYLMMVGMPIGGWLWMSTYPAPVSIFGLFNMPILPVVGQEALGETLHEAHKLGGRVMLVLVILHILGALKHQFVDKIPFLQRMWP